MTSITNLDTLSGEGDTAPDYPLLLTGGACLDDDGTIFVRTVIKTLNEKDIRHCVVLKHDGSGWQSFLINNGITAQHASNLNEWTLYSLGYNGIIHVSNRDTDSQEVIDGSRLGSGELRWMYDLKMIGVNLCAVGMSRMAYRRDSAGTWHQLGRGAEVTNPEDMDSCFRCIDGFSDDYLIAVGTKGEIWQCRDGVWRQMASPTNVALHGIICCEDNIAYACGAAGVVLRLLNDTWAVLDHDETEEQLWGMARFKGTTYFADSKAIYQIAGDQIKQVDMGIEATTSYLYSAPNVLWSVGESDVCRFDGSAWERLPLPKFPSRP